MEALQRNMATFCRWMQRHGHEMIEISYSGEGDSGGVSEILIDGESLESRRMEGARDRVLYLGGNYVTTVTNEGEITSHSQLHGKLWPVNTALREFFDAVMCAVGHSGYMDGLGGSGWFQIKADGIVSHSHTSKFADSSDAGDFELTADDPTLTMASKTLLEWMTANSMSVVAVTVELPERYIGSLYLQDVAGAHLDPMDTNVPTVPRDEGSVSVVEQMRAVIRDILAKPEVAAAMGSAEGSVEIAFIGGNTISISCSENFENEETDTNYWDVSERLTPAKTAKRLAP